MKAPNPDEPRWLRYVHRVGYATTALVALQMLFVAATIGSEWWGQRQIDATQRAQTRTHVGALVLDPRNMLTAGRSALLDLLPDEAERADESFRIAIDPSRSVYRYALAIIPSANRDGPAAVDFISAADDACDLDTPPTITRRSFSIATADYRAFAKWFDETTDNYRGSTLAVLDGTDFAFERRRGEQTTSGAGNIPDHHGKLAARLLTLLKPHLSGADIPTDESWHIPGTGGCAPLESEP